MKTGQAQEFSMDDVLESIRRIISDGETPAESDRASADPAISRGFLEGFEQAARTVSLADPEQVPPPRAPLRRETAEAAPRPPARPVAGPAAPVAPARSAATVRPLPPLRSTLSEPLRAEPARAEAPRAEAPPAEPVRADASRPAAGYREPARAPVPAPADRLMSRAAESAVESAFGSLGQAVVARQPQTTLEDLVKDLMRPMVSAWLDQNLPALVERLVQAEIQRLSRGD